MNNAPMTRRTFLGSACATLAAPPLLAGAGLRFVHPYGETVLSGPARRVVSIGYSTQDPLLALGVVPVGIRYWFGDFPHGVWPWAQGHLGSAAPVLITGEVSMETVAGLAPDLIVAIGSGISQAEYELLSRIAPVLMQSPEYSTYGSPWQDTTRRIGQAVGKSELAETLIAEVGDTFAGLRARHPDWGGRTAAAAWQSGGETGAFLQSDNRAQFLSELGFRPTEGLARAGASNGFYTTLSPEDLSPLDADLLVWVSAYDQVPDIVNLAMRRTLVAHRAGREVFAGSLVAGALSFGSVLSLPYALEQLEDDIAAALDGDPHTPVASAVTAGLAP
ncbi:iron-siderophore ABC transporter substrate-binding protein [Puniceibacterium sediminis]|nr:iron-siderophore ABC transporter substrate-binding protein [Puniceibacterium sediminis]